MRLAQLQHEAEKRRGWEIERTTVKPPVGEQFAAVAIRNGRPVVRMSGSNEADVTAALARFLHERYGWPDLRPHPIEDP